MKSNQKISNWYKCIKSSQKASNQIKNTRPLACALLSNSSCTNFELHEFFLSQKNVHLKYFGPYSKTRAHVEHHIWYAFILLMMFLISFDVFWFYYMWLIWFYVFFIWFDAFWLDLMHLYQFDVFWFDFIILEYSSWKSKNADAMESGLVKPDPLYIKDCKQIQFEMQN